MSTKIVELKKPKLKKPIFIEGLPGVGNVGRIAAGYLVEELKAKKFAELYSSHFMPFVLVQQESDVHMLKNEFYYWKAKKPNQRDLIILIGDSQSIDPEGHYEVCGEILNYIEKFNISLMINLAGLGVGEKKDKPEVLGVVNNTDLVKKYKKHGIKFATGNRIGTIVGASGLLLGLGKNSDIKGICLLGETSGVPLIPDPKSAEAVLNTLTKILNIDIDTSEIQKKVKEMEDFIKRIEKMQRKAFSQIMKERLQKPSEKGKEEEEDLSYIG
jgi:uncharacterized protein (TIGR00162 family)